MKEGKEQMSELFSDEEKKAIEWLKKADWFSARLYAPTILNLIEKQSKEIEELKEKTKKCEYYEMVADELSKELEELKEKLQDELDDRDRWE